MPTVAFLFISYSEEFYWKNETIIIANSNKTDLTFDIVVKETFLQMLTLNWLEHFVLMKTTYTDFLKQTINLD